MDEWPSLDAAKIAGLPVTILGVEGEAGINDEVKRGFILKADVNRVIVACGVDLGEIDDFAFDFFKTVKAAPGKAADGGFAAPGFGEPE